jgi:fluoroacetyl-CoA thioesterase
MRLGPGLHAEVELMVTDADTAAAVGSGDVPVLATPRLVALAEAATVAAVSAGLDAGQTSVGTLVRLEHLRASAVGSRVRVRAELVDVDGRQLRFDVTATDADSTTGQVVVGRGEVVRAVVDRQRFLGRLG